MVMNYLKSLLGKDGCLGRGLGWVSLFFFRLES